MVLENAWACIPLHNSVRRLITIPRQDRLAGDSVWRQGLPEGSRTAGSGVLDCWIWDLDKQDLGSGIWCGGSKQHLFLFCKECRLQSLHCNSCSLQLAVQKTLIVIIPLMVCSCQLRLHIRRARNRKQFDLARQKFERGRDYVL